MSEINRARLATAFVIIFGIILFCAGVAATRMIVFPPVPPGSVPTKSPLLSPRQSAMVVNKPMVIASGPPKPITNIISWDFGTNWNSNIITNLVGFIDIKTNGTSNWIRLREFPYVSGKVSATNTNFAGVVILTRAGYYFKGQH